MPYISNPTRQSLWSDAAKQQIPAGTTVAVTAAEATAQPTSVFVTSTAAAPAGALTGYHEDGTPNSNARKHV